MAQMQSGRQAAHAIEAAPERTRRARAEMPVTARLRRQPEPVRVADVATEKQAAEPTPIRSAEPLEMTAQAPGASARLAERPHSSRVHAEAGTVPSRPRQRSLF